MTPNDAGPAIQYLTSAATIVFVQRWLKQYPIYQQFVVAFPGADKYAHWVIAGVMSFVAATGIHWVWDGSWNDFVSGSGVRVTITIPMLSVLVHGLADWFNVYVLQAFGYAMISTKHEAVQSETVRSGGDAIIVPPFSKV